jgi:integrase
MPPRRRNIENLDLPPHVETDRKSSGQTYYRYIMPNGKRYSLGSDRQTAISTAHALNIEFQRNPNLMHQIIKKKNKDDLNINTCPPVEHAFDQFIQHRLDKKTYAESTRNNHRQQINKYKTIWHDRLISDISHRDITAFLNTLAPHAYLKHKNLMVQAWSFFLHQGWVEDNWPNKTMDAILPKKQRRPITHDQLMQIRAISPAHLQRAIDLALHSLQRREDLTILQRNMVNIPANTLTIRQGKSRNYKKPIFIEVDMHPALQQAVIACLSSPLAARCPYLLHYQPKRITPKIRAKQHLLAMTPYFLSHEFARYRDQTNLFDHLPPEQKPTFHEIRALGEYRLAQQYGKDYAKALAGHSTDAMYEHYVGRHEPETPMKISYKT